MAERRAQRALLAVALAAVGGFIDAVGFIALDQLFTAHMSGNTARLGVFLGHGDATEAIPFAVAVVLFVVGISLGAVVGELAVRRGVRSSTAVVLALEAALVLAFMLYGHAVIPGGVAPDHSIARFYVLAALLILATGTQTAAISKVAGRTVRTTYISGVLTNFAQEATNAVLSPSAGASYLRDELGLGSRSESRSRLLVLGGIAAAYLAGAVTGSAAHRGMKLWAMAIPLAVLAAAIAIDLRRPFSRPFSG